MVQVTSPVLTLWSRLQSALPRARAIGSKIAVTVAETSPGSRRLLQLASPGTGVAVGVAVWVNVLVWLSVGVEVLIAVLVDVAVGVLVNVRFGVGV
jgi:hypothetical protein